MSVPLTDGERIRVLIVDDSALVRSLLTRILSADPQIEVVGTAPDAFIAREKIKQLNPHVLTLDVEMPRMDGLQFLRNLMRLRPMPVVMCSSLTERGADVTLAALELGATDFVTKPRVDLAHSLEDYGGELIEKIKVAAKARSRARVREEGRDLAAARRAAVPLRFSATAQIIGIGASTGGTEAIYQVLSRLPVEAPGVVIAQHLPRAFSAQFATRLDACSALSVAQATDGALIEPGKAFVAPGDRQLRIERDGAYYRCRVLDEPPVNRHRPSVDVMFRSIAQHAGVNGVGVLLTGMGSDGARGLLELHERGGYTIAQDESSSIVWGMPGAAVALGAVDSVLPIEDIAGGLARASENWEQRRATGS